MQFKYIYTTIWMHSIFMYKTTLLLDYITIYYSYYCNFNM